jgi:hypothetical protein
MFDQFLGQKTNIFRTYSEIPGHFLDTFGDKFRTVFFHRVVDVKSYDNNTKGVE